MTTRASVASVAGEPGVGAAGFDVASLDAASLDAKRLNQVFFALSDPVRRAILERLGEGPALVSELAAPFDISLQAVSKHIQVLVRAGLVNQARSGRIAKCSLDVGPVFEAALWLNRYTEYWQAQFEALAIALGDIEHASGDAGATTAARASGSREGGANRKTLSGSNSSLPEKSGGTNKP
ncbi:MAG: ArsR/SmtB family transcription factor [Gammaproteobacteria bacterium]